MINTFSTQVLDSEESDSPIQLFVQGLSESGVSKREWKASSHSMFQSGGRRRRSSLVVGCRLSSCTGRQVLPVGIFSLGMSSAIAVAVH